MLLLMNRSFAASCSQGQSKDLTRKADAAAFKAKAKTSKGKATAGILWHQVKTRAKAETEATTKASNERYCYGEQGRAAS